MSARRGCSSPNGLDHHARRDSRPQAQLQHAKIGSTLRENVCIVIGTPIGASQTESSHVRVGPMLIKVGGFFTLTPKLWPWAWRENAKEAGPPT